MKSKIDALAWLNSQVGQHLDYDHIYGQQCVDFFNFYYQFVTGDNPYADGYQVVGAKSLFGIVNSRLDRLVDTNSLSPQAGDIAVYGPLWGGGLGHTEVCVGSDANGATFIGENEHGNQNEGVVNVYRTWSQMRGLEGVLRFHYATPLPTPQTLHLPAEATSWRVYNIAGPYTVGHEVAMLSPAKWGGLTYQIQRWISDSVCIIHTQMFGTVAIYVGAGTGAVIS